MFDSGSGYLSTLSWNAQGHQGLLAALCKSASSGKPYLSQPAPLVALCREQRFTPASWVASHFFERRAEKSRMHEGERSAQRATARRARRSLAPIERHRASLAIAKHLAASPWLRPAARVAAFLGVGDELDTTALLALLATRRCVTLLPRITDPNSKKMTFSRVGAPLRPNRYGIPEPPGPDRLDARWCDIVLLPLLAFDAQGHRLGTGGGYYDRALAFRRSRRTWRGPLLIGIAHSTQQLPAIEPNATDVALDAIVTERGIRFFQGISA